MLMSNNNYTNKIVILGDCPVGKTAIINTFLNGVFVSKDESTLGVNCCTKIVDTQYGPIELVIWDTSGQTIYRNIIPFYLNGTSAVIIVVDISNYYSNINSLETWYDFAKINSPNSQIYIVANKIDLLSESEKNEAIENIEKWSYDHSFPFFITSAKQPKTVQSVFQKVAEDTIIAAKRIQIDSNKKSSKIGSLMKFFSKKSSTTTTTKKNENESTNEIEELKTKLLGKEEEISNLNKEIANLNKEISDLKNENIQKNMKIEELQAQNKEYENRLKKTVSDANQEKEPLQNQQVYIDNCDEDFHKVICKIGEGATSEAFKVIDTRTSRAICKKVIKDTGDQNFKIMQNSMKEIEVLFKIRHPCICEAIGINMQEKISSNIDDDCSTPRTTIALFFEFLPYSLLRLIDNKLLCSTLKTRIAVEIAFGMSHIHSLGLIHRDLKVENVMLNGVMEAKLIDFGLVHVPGFSNTLTRGIGTLDYMSPEMVREENYDNKTDIYSYGIFLIVLFTGQIPHQKMTDKVANIAMNIPQTSKKMSEYCIKLVRRCTSPKAENRPTFDEIIDELVNMKFELTEEVDYDLVYRRYRELNSLRKYHK